MIIDAWWPVPLTGLFVGVVLGATARYARFCTLSSLERYWYAGESRGIRTWVLAAAVALLLTQALVLANVVDTKQSFYLLPRISVVGGIVGGILFGIGMALVGTCGFGALVRLGGGSLRSLIIVAVIGITALGVQKGPLGVLRERFVEPLALTLQGSDQSIPAVVAAWTALPIEWLVSALCIAGLFAWVFSDSRFRHDRSAITSGSIIGLCVAAGWYVTSQFSRAFFEPVQIESASFVLPPGQLVQSTMFVNSPAPDYGVGLVIGVVLGAALIAWRDHDIRWEACDDARELGRHLGGAMLMGVGGVLAAGCTIGQGISAVSLLATSAPIVILSMLLGARLGLSWLLEGRPLSFLQFSGGDT